MRLFFSSFLFFFISTVFFPSVIAVRKCYVDEGTYDNGIVEQENGFTDIECPSDPCTFHITKTENEEKAKFRIGCGNVEFPVGRNECKTVGLKFTCACDIDQCFGTRYIGNHVRKFVQTGKLELDFDNYSYGFVGMPPKDGDIMGDPVLKKKNNGGTPNGNIDKFLERQDASNGNAETTNISPGGQFTEGKDTLSGKPTGAQGGAVNDANFQYVADNHGSDLFFTNSFLFIGAALVSAM